MMLNPLVDSRDVRFVLFEILEADRLCRHHVFSQFDRETFESVLDLAETVAVEYLYPANAQGDKIGVLYNPSDGTVTVPAVYRDAMAVFNETGFTGIGNDTRWGGMGMPDVIYRAVMEYFFAASISFTMNVSLLVGATNLVKNFGSHERKDLILEKMMAGKWGGTMCLTEPGAGSDVGALVTRAVRRDDGTYLISGQKIFISAGDNDLYENIIHPVLARIEGDPAGTRGISIFMVPKYHINPDGSPGEVNDVVCSGIEHKMGIKASPTCTLNFGDNGRCVGYLMGEERQGMKIMFQMMNEARLDVALQGLAVSSSAYMHAVTYAKNRVQGNAPAAIINHPDIRRMLLWMKSHVEAMRMLTMLAAMTADEIHCGDAGAAKESGALLEFLIPLCKAGNTDLAWLITAEAIQVFGGYGYCSDYPVEQLARDSKILSIYEGTNGIQSMDLTLRKLLMNPGMYNYSIFKKRIGETIQAARGLVEDEYIAPVVSAVKDMDRVIEFLSACREGGDMETILVRATPLQQAMRILAHAWMHLWSLTKSIPALGRIAGDAGGDTLELLVRDNTEAAFYYGRVVSSRFFLGTVFSDFRGRIDGLLSRESAVADSFDVIFTGAPEQ